ncbi:MAG: TonB-dependent receptor [Acidobacteria bacterium]|nr:TonB-dependent receptor [Acidobacteriota bacterium]
MRFREWVCLFALVVLIGSAALAQVNTVDLDVRVLDPSDAAIKGAKVTVKNVATSATRTGESDESGRALFVQLPPGRYQVTVEASGFARLVNPELVLTIGQAAEFHAHMKIQTGAETITVTETTEMIEVRRTAVAETVDSRRIASLPINGRNYINFTLTNSQAARDSAPSIGAAPTSGINFGGARARSNQVSVDGADATDNSVNGVRATVSQEAVQEFQVIMSNYMPEFGRATGGVINIVTKGGSNEVHGNVFGFLRHKTIQARNPFSVEVNPTTGAVTAVKQGYTRFQGGATIGGPIKKDKTFYFLSYETTRRQESGFTNIGSNNFGLVSATTPVIPGVTMLLTPAQAAFVNNLTVLAAPGGAALAARVFLTAGSASSVALNRVDPGLLSTLGFGVPAAPGARFPALIDCPIPVPCTAANQVALPASFVNLRALMGNYPIKEGTSLWSARLDHQWNDKNNSFVRVNVTPSKVTGIQVNAQNQNFGQNAGSRTSLNQTRDFAVVGQHVTAFTQTFFNEFRTQFARRGLHYGFADLPGGSDVGVNITGFAFFGREPFSTVDRIERRWQWTDNMTWTKGRHNIKFGGDINLIQLRSKKDQIFELNFGGLFNFGGLTATELGLPASVGGVALPGITAVQAYGLGAPQVFIQGIGSSRLPLSNTTYAGFIQDSWKVHPRLTLNFGARYDVELTPVFASSTPMNRAAENALGVLLGIPRDKNNWSPRFALAWDPMGNGNTVVRAGYGIFFDHPLLAVAFNSATADGARSTQLLSAGGSATRTSVLVNPIGALNAGSIFQGVLNAPASFGYLSAQQRFDPKLANSIFVNQNYITAGVPLTLLPFTLHVDKDFRYGYAQQANFTVERKMWNDYKISASYTYTHGVKLNRPRNITPPNAGRLIRNFRNAIAGGLTPSRPTSVAVPGASTLPTASACGITVLAPGLLGVLGGCPASPAPNSGFNGQFIGTAAFFNFFRPTGPNPSFAGLLPGGYGTPTTPGSQVFLAGLAGFPTGTSGVPVPFSDVMQQESSGGSVYHGLTINFTKRFSKNFEVLSSWTWSHSIDDSTDLQTLLAPQNNNRPDLERSNSTFDQRHRWVTSAVIQTPWKRTDPGAWHKFFADFTVAPIVEWATGRPFSVLTGSDFNLDFGSNTDRPSFAQTGGVLSPFVQSGSFLPPTVCPADPASPNGAPTNTLFAGLPVPSFFGCTGNLGRNKFFRPRFFTTDLRIARKFHFGEKWNMEFITDMFNLTNKFNVGDVSPLCNPLDPSTCRAGEPTAALDPRQFQFAIKINW